MSVTDAVTVRNWQRFSEIWKTTLTVPNTTFERTFIHAIGYVCKHRKTTFMSKMFLSLNSAAKTNIFDQVFVQNLGKNQKKMISQKWLLSITYWNWKFLENKISPELNFTIYDFFKFKFRNHKISVFLIVHVFKLVDQLVNYQTLSQQWLFPKFLK